MSERTPTKHKMPQVVRKFFQKEVCMNSSNADRVRRYNSFAHETCQVPRLQLQCATLNVIAAQQCPVVLIPKQVKLTFCS